MDANDYDVEGKELIEIPDNELMLTTLDNPYNPKKDYDKWRKFDIDNNYFTEEYLDRVAEIPPDLEDEYEIDQLLTDAMLSILEDDVIGTYKLI